MDDPVIVRTFTQRGEAEIARGLLEAEGIPAVITADDAGSTTPSLDFVLGAELVVESTDVERAREILDELTLVEDLETAARESEGPAPGS